MADISKVILPDNNEYNLKDHQAIHINKIQSVEGAEIDSDNQASIEKLLVNIGPTQKGSGDPSLTNIRAFVGYTEAEITRAGVNLIGGTRLKDRIVASYTGASVDTTNKTVSFSSGATANQYVFSSLYSTVGGQTLPFKANTQYTFIFTFSNNSSNPGNPVNLKINYTDGTSTNLSSTVSTANTKVTQYKVSTANKTISYVSKHNSGGTTKLYYDECAILEGAYTASDFIAYNGETKIVDWSSICGTIYEGTIDTINGKLYNNAVLQTLTGSESWNAAGSGSSVYYRLSVTSDLTMYKGAEGICSHFQRTSITSDTTNIGFNVVNSSATATFTISIRPGVSSVTNLDTFKTWLTDQYNAETPVQVLYYYKTPIEYNITPFSLNILNGKNTVWANTGDILQLGYISQDTQNFIDYINNESNKLISNDIEPVAKASKNYSIGDYLILNSNLYKVSAAIASGETLTVGTNITQTTVCEQLKALAFPSASGVSF